MLKSKFVQGLMVASAVAMLAACSSDGSSSLGGSGPGGGGGGGLLTTLSTPQLGITGDGGATDAIGLAALTDPILGTDGLLGGGSDGEIGGKIPAGALEPLSSQLAPIADQIAGALPLGMVTGQLPTLGVDGKGGLVQDITGQDLLTGIVGSTGVVGGLLGGGNAGQLGDIVPPGTIPALPGISDGGGGPLAALTSAIPGGGNADVLGQLQNLPGLTQTLVGGAAASDPQKLLGTVTGVVTDPGALTGVLSQLTKVGAK